MTVTGPDFIALQVRDLDSAAAFYEDRLGLRRAPVSPPNAIVFGTTPVPFAVRDPLPGVDLDAADRPAFGVALWLHASDAQALHDRLAAAGVPIVTAPFDGPFGRTFTFTDPDGYALTIHDKAVSAATNSFRMRARGPFALAAAARFTEAFPAGQGAAVSRASTSPSPPKAPGRPSRYASPRTGRACLRPVQFHSPYEAAAWTVIGQRIG